MGRRRLQLRTMLLQVAEGCSTASLAVAFGQGDPEVVWVPDATADEPCSLAYSITKTFSAALVLLLRDEGHLALDDPLARWFPRIAEAERITLRQLLNHTAGIPDYGALRRYHEELRAAPGSPWSFERFMAETVDKGLRFAPGSGWAYSNPGYMLLRRIVEAAGNASFATLIAERIARPLQLRRTFVPDSIEALASLAPAWSRALASGGKARDIRSHYHPGWVSHAVVASTSSGIVRFLAGLFGGRLLSTASLAEMTTLVPVPGGRAGSPIGWRQPSYGLGIMADPASRWGRIWGHNGGGPGYQASAFYAPDMDGVAVCAMCSTEEASAAEELAVRVLDAIRPPGGLEASMRHSK